MVAQQRKPGTTLRASIEDSYAGRVEKAASVDAMVDDALRLVSGQCPICGTRNALRLVKDESFSAQAGDARDIVERLSGDRCSTCHEVMFDAASAERYAGAGDALVLKSRKAESE